MVVSSTYPFLRIKLVIGGLQEEVLAYKVGAKNYKKYSKGVISKTRGLRHMREDKCLKVAVIGLGKMGLLHASILNTLPNVELSVICDKDTKIVRFARKVFSKISVIDSLEKLSSFNLDAIYVTTPIPSHSSIIETIYSGGIARNLFVEKTLASNYKEAVKLCEIAQSSGGVNMVGYMSRFAVTYRRAKELLEQEAIGKAISFKAYAYSSDFVGSKKKSTPRGGALKDLGAHVIDLALWVFGDLQIESAKLEPSASKDSEDTGYFKVKGPNGLEGEFDISWSREGYRSPEFGLAIRGTTGNIKVDNDSVKLESNDGNFIVWYRHDLDDIVDFLLAAPEYFREDEHFVKSILEGDNTECDFSAASNVDYLIEQVNRKAK